MHSRTRFVSAGAAIAAAALLAAGLAPQATAAPTGNDTSEIALTKGFRKAVTTAGINEHLKAFEAIAAGGNRVSGTPKFDASVAYVKSKAEAAGLNVTVQPFDFPYNADVAPAVLQRISPNPATFVDGVDFASMTYSGNGDVTGLLYAVNLSVPPPAVPGSTTSGCNAADFAGFPAGAIALIQRGTCDFRVKALNAQGAGAIGVVIMNEGQPGRTAALSGTLSSPGVTIPVVGASFAVGDSLRGGVTNGSINATVRLKVERVNETRTTYNVIAETPGGDPNNVVVVGAHLDSVPRGPGINDNGSGSATILEVAETFAAQERTPKSKVRFAWWGAEEFGLLGSNHYVASLTPAQLDTIALNLNFDMIGSPNYVRFVYDGDNSAFPVGPGAAVGPAGSGAIEDAFHRYFAAVGLASSETPFSGRSDYGPFIAKGIPAGGLFTGAEGTKTEAEAKVYGGTAGQSYDACYHLFCDAFTNVNQTGLDEMSDAVAHAVLTYSRRDFVKAPLLDPAKVMAGVAAGGEGGGLHEDHADAS
ncbi:Zn-dependent M28 family amino/carboxypeptidase [Humibacillus xanthopallidus]|uniref:Zn-dependent M28 family amino/carboxypeptidase n=1 Tax=Humibacillus xanthopallidus TaxID=412689 RepID=A0A543PMM3_9MICO|nr:M28 family metallopeptidase [Humibacillus xanthopallidus]TQN45335.1 Zn-dependent M28 family amino/carboxypeptidase [Humibacillus xanthopallidus]